MVFRKSFWTLTFMRMIFFLSIFVSVRNLVSFLASFSLTEQLRWPGFGALMYHYLVRLLSLGMPYPLPLSHRWLFFSLSLSLWRASVCVINEASGRLRLLTDLANVSLPARRILWGFTQMEWRAPPFAQRRPRLAGASRFIQLRLCMISVFNQDLCQSTYAEQGTRFTPLSQGRRGERFSEWFGISLPIAMGEREFIERRSYAARYY